MGSFQLLGSRWVYAGDHEVGGFIPAIGKRVDSFR